MYLLVFECAEVPLYCGCMSAGLDAGARAWIRGHAVNLLVAAVAPGTGTLYQLCQPSKTGAVSPRKLWASPTRTNIGTPGYHCLGELPSTTCVLCACRQQHSVQASRWLVLSHPPDTRDLAALLLSVVRRVSRARSVSTIAPWPV